SVYAPKIEMVKIPVEKIGELIGPGGKTIKNIIASTGATVDVEDDGSVAISGTDDEAVQKAVEWVKSLTREVQPGEEFEGEVKRILPFGAFVEILPGKEGMVHVSQMSTEFVKNPNDFVSIGQKVKVKVIEIDEQGRINLTMLMGDAPPREGGENRGGGRREGSFDPNRRTEDRPRSFDRAGQKDSAPSANREPKEEHPLARQFKREQQEEREKTFGPRRGGASNPRFRKPRY
ncbi:MAG: S1 RNA-binding domain-containing protein, partial [Patescibacteria group bacterium]